MTPAQQFAQAVVDLEQRRKEKASAWLRYSTAVENYELAPRDRERLSIAKNVAWHDYLTAANAEDQAEAVRVKARAAYATSQEQDFANQAGFSVDFFPVPR